MDKEKKMKQKLKTFAFLISLIKAKYHSFKITLRIDSTKYQLLRLYLLFQGKRFIFSKDVFKILNMILTCHEKIVIIDAHTSVELVTYFNFNYLSQTVAK